MANYMCVSRTNYFRVTDEDKYEKLFNGLVAEDNIHDFSYIDEDGVIWHGFGVYGGIDYLYGEENKNGEEYCIDDFYEKLQDILPDNEAFMFFESGYEKLRYVTGLVVVVTKNNIEYMDICSWGIAKAKEILGNDFTTKVDY